MGSAPRDGTEILAWRDDAGVLLVCCTCAADLLTESELEELDEESAESFDWFCADLYGGERLEGSDIPTHWRPLPAPPTRTEAEGQNECPTDKEG